jgi:hypothetical protein
MATILVNTPVQVSPEEAEKRKLLARWEKMSPIERDKEFLKKIGCGHMIPKLVAEFNRQQDEKNRKKKEGNVQRK